MTAKTVSDEVLGRIARKQADLFRRVREGTLDPESVSRGLQALIEGRVSPFRFDKLKDGWTLLEDYSSTIAEVSELELVSFLKEGESSVTGEEMRARAVTLRGNFSQRQAEYLLDYQDEIPVEWRSYYLVFPATLWRAADGGLGVPCLDWSGGRWCLSFSWLVRDWGSGARLLRSCK